MYDKSQINCQRIGKKEGGKKPSDFKDNFRIYSQFKTNSKNVSVFFLQAKILPHHVTFIVSKRLVPPPAQITPLLIC